MAGLLPALFLVFRLISEANEQGLKKPTWAEAGAGALRMNLLLLLAALGPSLILWQKTRHGWPTGLDTALWATIAACLVLFAGVVFFQRKVWRLGLLLLPYLLLLAGLATLDGMDGLDLPAPLSVGSIAPTWIILHILVSVVAYACITLAAIAALAVFLQERALKRKSTSRMSMVLPPMVVAERLVLRLLILCELILASGLISGLAVLHYLEGTAFRLDHKTLFSLATFLTIGGMLAAHAWTGIRGRSASRLILIAYLLLTLAYPGVKLVRECFLS
jgi:ABC-type uncharacterized transport system permease subunit